MKKILLALLTLMSLTTFAQIRVKENSFHNIEGFVMLDKKDHYDDNDRPMALIKISTENISAAERTRMTFKGNLETYFDPHFEPSEIYLYISTAATFIEIHHPDYGKTEFRLPYDLKDFCAYEMVVVSDFYGGGDAIPMVNYLTIKTDQNDAMIFIDDEFAGLKDVSKLLSVGKNHSWRIECDMYHTESGKVTLTQGEPTILEKKLRPAYGFVNITTSPTDEADIYIDNKYVGKTPYFSNEISSGEHKMVLVKDMYKSSNHNFTVLDNDTTTLNINMISNVKYVTILADSLSYIYVDNQEKGIGKWSGGLSYGTHLFEARKPSHRTSFFETEVKIGSLDTIVLTDPTPIVGFLSVTTEPLGASIYVDGVYEGLSPRVINDILIGEHEVKLKKNNYVQSMRTVNIKENETVEISETLEIGKDITITTDMVGDKIYVDRQYIGESPQTINLSFGVHTIMVERGSLITDEDFNVQPDGKSEVNLFFGKNIKISTDHNGDYVYIDGKEIGQSPCITGISYGKHNLKVVRGKYALNKTIVVERNDNIDEIALKLGKNITINTSQKGDAVFVDGSLIGKTPLTTYLTFDTHNVKVVRKGKMESTKSIDVKDEGQSEFTIYYGQLVTLNSNKEGDAVFVDGKKEGETPLELDLTFGNHIVTVKRHRKIDSQDLHISKTSDSYYNFYPVKETINQFNNNGIRFLAVTASPLENDRLMYGLNFGGYKKAGWYFSFMSNYDKNQFGKFSGVTQFLPEFQNNANNYNEENLLENYAESRLSAMFGLMFRVVGPAYLKIGGGYAMYNTYCQTVYDDWARIPEMTFNDVLLSAGLQFNFKNLVLTSDFVTTKDFKTMELRFGLGLAWKKRK